LYAKITDKNETLIPDSELPISFTTQRAELIIENPVKAEAEIASFFCKNHNQTNL
jgi:hypothetical protein